MVVVGINKNIVARSIRDRLVLLIAKMEDSIRKVVNDNNSDFNKVANEILQGIVGVVLDNEVNQSISELFNAYDLVGDTARNRYLLNRELFAFAEDETQINNNPDLSLSLQTIDLNIQLLNIGFAYTNSTEITFSNTDDLQGVIDDLEAEYQRLKGISLIDQDTRIDLINIRTGSMEFFTTLDLSVIKTIKTLMKPSRIISYENYASSDNAEVIVSLNKANNTPFIVGEIKIISDSQ